MNIEIANEIKEYLLNKDKDCKIYPDNLIAFTDFVEKDRTKQLFLYGVSQQRELLIAFHKWQQKMWTNPNSEITENVVDVYLKRNL